jgi:hypothetical protein
MTTVTAKQLLTAAASIRGARAAGVRTPVAEAFLAAAPEMIESAAAEIRRIDDLGADVITDALHVRGVQLRNALAEFCAVVGAVDPIGAERAEQAARQAAEQAAKAEAKAKAEADAAAHDEAERLAAWDQSAEAEVILTMAGEQLAWVEVEPAHVVGWSHDVWARCNGRRVAARRELMTRDGQVLPVGALYVAQRDFFAVPVDGNGWATFRRGEDRSPVDTCESDVEASDWMPANARPQQVSEWHRIGYESDVDAEQAWDEARQARAAERQAAAPAPAAPKPATLADLAAALGGKRKRL